MERTYKKFISYAAVIVAAIALVAVIGTQFKDASLKATDEVAEAAPAAQEHVVQQVVVEAPKAEAPAAETPKTEAPAAEAPKEEAPKADEAKEAEPAQETEKAAEPAEASEETQKTETEEIPAEEAPEAENLTEEEPQEAEEAETEETEEEPETLCTCGAAEGEAHAETCPLFTASEEAEPVCTCGAAEGEPHAEDCPLYEELPALSVTIQVSTPQGRKDGAPVILTAVVSGADANEVNYQWQCSSNGASWSNVGSNNSQHTFTLNESTSGDQWRVIVNRK